MVSVISHTRVAHIQMVSVISHTCIAHIQMVSVISHTCVAHMRIIRAIQGGEPIGYLIFKGYLPQKSPIISGSFAETDLQLKVSYGSLPLCTTHALLPKFALVTHGRHILFRLPLPCATRLGENGHTRMIWGTPHVLFRVQRGSNWQPTNVGCWPRSPRRASNWYHSNVCIRMCAICVRYVCDMCRYVHIDLFICVL